MLRLRLKIETSQQLSDMLIHCACYPMLPLLEIHFVSELKGLLHFLRAQRSAIRKQSFMSESDPFSVTHSFVLIKKQSIPKIEGNEFHTFSSALYYGAEAPPSCGILSSCM